MAAILLQNVGEGVKCEINEVIGSMQKKSVVNTDFHSCLYRCFKSKTNHANTSIEFYQSCQLVCTKF